MYILSRNINNLVISVWCLWLKLGAYWKRLGAGSTDGLIGYVLRHDNLLQMSDKATRGKKRMELLLDMTEGRDYRQLKDLISDRSRGRQDSKSACEKPAGKSRRLKREIIKQHVILDRPMTSIQYISPQTFPWQQPPRSGLAVFLYCTINTFISECQTLGLSMWTPPLIKRWLEETYASST